MAPWDPTAARRFEPVTLPLDCAGGEATITLKRWDGATRLAYEDGTLDAVRIDYAESDPNRAIRRVIPSQLALLHLRLTIVGWDGWPTHLEVERDGETRLEVTDLRDPVHLATLDTEVREELSAKAVQVQPFPSSRVKQPEDRKAPEGARAGDTSSADDEGDEDPTPTP